MIRALYVDDEPALHDVVSRLLERQGRIQVEAVVSVQEALGRLSTFHFDVIISDYDMPHLTGLDLLTSLRQEGNETPFILFTGKARDEVCIQALSNGADYYLQKAGDPQTLYLELFHKISRAVERKRNLLALQRSEEQVQTLLHLLSDTAGVWERSGGSIRWKENPDPVSHSPMDVMTNSMFSSHCLVGQGYLVPECVQSCSSLSSENPTAPFPDYEAILTSILTPEEIAVAVITPDERITHWNCGARRLLGYDPSEMIGKPLSSLVSPGFQTDLSGLLTRIQNLGSLERTQAVCMKKDGTKVRISLIFSPVLNRSGSLIGISIIGREKNRMEYQGPM